MPYLEQRRSNAASSRKHVVSFGSSPSVNRIESSDTYMQDWRRDYLYGYRDKGLSDLGQSLEYENLSGRDLRNEVIAQGHRTSRYDTGHPCKISHDLVRFADAYSSQSFVYGREKGQYSGDLWWYPTKYGTPSPYAGFLPSDPGWFPSSVVNGYGTRALKRFQPLDKSSLALLTSLVEIYRDGLPKIPTLRALNAVRGGGKVYSPTQYADEFLNAQFGWAPMVSDLKGVADLIVKAGIVTRRIDDGVGVSKRGSGVLDVQSGSSAGKYSQDLWTCRFRPTPTAAPIDLGSYLSTSSRVDVSWVENYTTSIRFAGEFEYYFQKLSKLRDNVLSRAEHLLGLELTPEVAWQTQPWTWLLDWFGNLGQIISIASNTVSDSSVCKYGYLMFDTVAQRSESARINLKNGSSWVSVIHGTSIRYQRERANPYGFGTNPAAFTNRQWAVLGALGLTRAPKVLRLWEP